MSFQVVKNITDQDIFMIPQNEIDHLINYKHFLTDAQKRRRFLRTVPTIVTAHTF